MAKKRSHAARHSPKDPGQFYNIVAERVAERRLSFVNAIHFLFHELARQNKGKSSSEEILMRYSTDSGKRQIHLESLASSSEEVVVNLLVIQRYGSDVTQRLKEIRTEALAETYESLLENIVPMAKVYGVENAEALQILMKKIGAEKMLEGAAESREKTLEEVDVSAAMEKARQMAEEYIANVSSVVDEVAQEFGIGGQGKGR